MTSRDFCYWLQGFFEIAGSGSHVLTSNQIDCVKCHLAMVFKHEIDPSFPKDQQEELNKIHKPPLTIPQLNDPVLRC